MNLGITLRNYRCFPDDQPAMIQLEEGFTALVGSNNSGKSTLLRFFWEFRFLFDMLSNPNAIYAALQGVRQNAGFPDTVRDGEEVFCNGNSQDLTIEFDLSEIDISQLPARVAPFPTRLVVDFDRKTKSWSAKASVQDHPLPRSGMDLVGQGNTYLLRHASEMRADLGAIIEVFKRLTQCVYIPAYRNAINVGATERYFDIQTGQSFITQWRAWQSGDYKEHHRAAHAMIATIRKIFGYDRLEVHAANNNQTLQLMIDDVSYMLPEVGSGIAQFFMVLANAAIKRPSFVLIDEPELNLHPALQREFLRCLASYATGGVVFATHNLGLALAQADRTYSVQRIRNGRSTVQLYGETPRLSEFLGELSFGGYKQLGFDKVLLVEGVTEVRAVQHFLSLYGKQDKVVLLHLGGDTMINGKRQEELREVQRICPHVAALIDSEKGSATAGLKGPRQDFLEACKGLSPPIRCHVLARRSIENYFTDVAVKAALGPAVSGLAHYDPVPKGWKKANNWRIAQEMQRTDIEGTDLGQFIASL